MRFQNIVAMGLDSLSHPDLNLLTKAVVQSADNNPLYPNFVNPTIPELKILAQAFSNALINWADGKGSRMDYDALITNRIALCNGLNGLALSAQSQTPGNRSALGTINWPLRGENSPNGVLGAVKNVRQLQQKGILQGTLKIAFNRPYGSKGKRIKYYRVLRSNTGDFSQAVVVGEVGKTVFIDENPGEGLRWYWVIAVNSRGDGVISEPCTAIAKPQG